MTGPHTRGWLADRPDYLLRQLPRLLLFSLFWLQPLPESCVAAPPQAPTGLVSAANASDHRPHRWPSWSKVQDTLLLKQYNTRLVLLGTTLLGIGAGTVGTFMLLRRRSLIGDVVSHASLPGIALAFLAAELIHPGTGRSLPSLMLGALAAGLLGVLCTMTITRFSRIKEDAALAIVLSVFFGAGIALFTVIQKLPTGQIAGLQRFIYGQTAAMSAADVRWIATSSTVVVFVSILFFKEFGILCFDEEFGRSQGWPTVGLDLALMGLVVTMSIIGLQSVGLLLVVAMLIIPAAAARFWTERLGPMTIIAAFCGGTSAWLGGVVSSLFSRFSAGAVIVLVGSLCFGGSLLLGTRRGLLPRWLAQRTSRRLAGRHDLSRAIYETLEPRLADSGSSLHGDPLCHHVITHAEILSRRSWTSTRVDRLLRTAVSNGSLTQTDNGWRLTEHGATTARQVAKNHRLWETYLILHADIATTHVDRDADLTEHVLDADLVAELLETVRKRYPQMDMPPSPHPLDTDA